MSEKVGVGIAPYRGGRKPASRLGRANWPPYTTARAECFRRILCMYMGSLFVMGRRHSNRGLGTSRLAFIDENEIPHRLIGGTYPPRTRLDACSSMRWTKTFPPTWTDFSACRLLRALVPSLRKQLNETAYSVALESSSASSWRKPTERGLDGAAAAPAEAALTCLPRSVDSVQALLQADRAQASAMLCRVANLLR